MKYSAVILSLALSAFALPQDASTITSAPAAPSASLTPQVSCALACDPKDVTCQAACMGIARPNTSQVVETNECAAKCDQGDGSKADSDKFSDCVQSCIASFFPSSQTLGVGAPAASSVLSNAASVTGSAGAAVSSGASQAASGTGNQPSGSGSPTGSASQASGTGAANSNTVQYAGLAGLAMAIFAL